jgi:hypothetical protein
MYCVEVRGVRPHLETCFEFLRGGKTLSSASRQKIWEDRTAHRFLFIAFYVSDSGELVSQGEDGNWPGFNALA